MKRKFEEELSEAREDYRKEKAEREHLRVRNSLLQDMSKIIVDKCMKPSNDPKKKKYEEEINIVDEDLGEDIVRNKSKGYRRVSPANNAERENVFTRPNQSSFQNSSTRNGAGNNEDYRTDGNAQQERVQYCHFYNNSGRCSFSERLGRPCRFAHKLAPVCNFDGQCNRPKCMFRHSQPPANAFLEPMYPTAWNQRAQMERFASQRPWGNSHNQQ